jgi:hypothetical protein
MGFFQELFNEIEYRRAFWAVHSFLEINKHRHDLLVTFALYFEFSNPISI